MFLRDHVYTKDFTHWFESRIILPDSFEADTASLVLSHRRDGILCYDDIAKTSLI